MNVKDLMTRNPVRCHPGTDLRTAAQLMWHADCGVLPVVDDSDEVVGVITDRDIAMAVGTQHRMPHEVRTHEIMSDTVYQCSGSDTLESAMALMKEHQIRRLPVTHHGKIQGMLSINDLLLEGDLIPESALRETLHAICRHRAAIKAVPEPV